MSKGKNTSRRGERALAFQVLYGLSFAPATSLGALRTAFRRYPESAEKEPAVQAEAPATAPQGFAWELVEGVWSNSAALDSVITRFSRNWRVDRMGRIELTLLRLGMYEMLYRDDIPPKVAINEALELAKQFGEGSARSFVNGILDAASKALENGELSHEDYQEKAAQ